MEAVAQAYSWSHSKGHQQQCMVTQGAEGRLLQGTYYLLLASNLWMASLLLLVYLMTLTLLL
jgi:hypothetical protein